MDNTLGVGQPYRHAGRPIFVRLGAANVNQEVRHQVPEIPTGLVVLRSSGSVTAAPGVAWTKELATVRSTLANDEVTLMFVVLKEEPLDVTT